MSGFSALSELPLATLPTSGGTTIASAAFSFAATASFQPEARSIAGDSFSISAQSVATWDGTDIGGATYVSDSFQMSAQGTFSPDARIIVPDSALVSAASVLTWDGTNAAVPTYVSDSFGFNATSLAQWIGTDAATTTQTIYGIRASIEKKFLVDDDEEIIELLAAILPHLDQIGKGARP